MTWSTEQSSHPGHCYRCWGRRTAPLSQPLAHHTRMSCHPRLLCMESGPSSTNWVCLEHKNRNSILRSILQNPNRLPNRSSIPMEISFKRLFGTHQDSCHYKRTRGVPPRPLFPRRHLWAWACTSPHHSAAFQVGFSGRWAPPEDGDPISLSVVCLELNG
jgi:hypothetical protein